MARRTLKGYELAEALRSGRTPAERLKMSHQSIDVEVCSLLCRSAVTYLHVQEGHCNGHPACSSPYIDAKTASKLQERFEARLEKREEQLEKHISKLAAQLPGVKEVKFGGDPRGSTIKLVMKDGRCGGDWGQEGIPVPGS